MTPLRSLGRIWRNFFDAVRGALDVLDFTLSRFPRRRGRGTRYEKRRPEPAPDHYEMPSRHPAEEAAREVRRRLEVPEPRYLNVALIEEGERPISTDQPLRAGALYELKLDIGEISKDSIVRDRKAVPVDLLPPREDGHWLQVAVASPDFAVTTLVSNLFLPTQGPAWVCSCEPGGPHTCLPQERRPHLLISMFAPPEPGAAHARLTLYFQNNVIQSVQIAADVVAPEDPRPTGGVVAVTDYTLSERLRDLDRLEPRLASVVINETTAGSHLLVFKGPREQTVPITFSEGQLTNAMDEARKLLLDIHIKPIGKARENRLLKGNRKTPADLRQDLTRLAEVGAGFWTGLFGVVGDPLETAGESESRTLQIARVPSSVFVFPWAVVYDLPLGSAQEGFTYCPLIEQWDGEGPLVADAAAECPHAASHRGVANVICPYGFWGFRYAIEEPASTSNRPAPLTVGASEPFSLVVAESHELNSGETKRHLSALQAQLPGFSQTCASTRVEVGECLAEPQLEIAYFYCHGKSTATGKPCLEVGKAEEIPPEQIVTWHRTAWRQVPQHWRQTQPLVFLNGCHTAELSPQSPVNFVESFSQVGASGVVGTEITLEQGMASEAAEVFFGLLGGPQGLGVGEALRRTRLHFLAKGNVLGLTYTAYCRSDLTLY